MVKKTYLNLDEEQLTADATLGFFNTSGIMKRDTYRDVIELSMHTGVRNGMELAIASPTTFDIAAGEAIIVNLNPDPLTPIVTRIVSAGFTNITDDFLGDSFTFVFLDNLGAIVQRNTPPSTLDDLNDLIFVGQIRHFGSIIVNLDDNPIMAHGSSSSHMAELVLSGGVKLSGARIKNDIIGDLSVSIFAGILEQFGRGRAQNQSSPNEYQTSNQITIPAANFFKAYVNTLGEFILDNSTNQLDPTQFSDGGTLSIVQANRFTTIRLFQAAGTEAVIFYYGTAEFTTVEAAINAIEPSFVEHPDTIQISPIAKIAIKENTTDFESALNSGDAVIQPVMRRV